MIIKFLGTGDPLGMPVAICKCLYCQTARKNKMKQRLRPSILIGDKVTQLLFDMSPDIRIQLTNIDIKRLAAIFISHAHFDHLYGICDFSQLNYFKKVDVPIYMNKNTFEYIKRYLSWVTGKFKVYENNREYRFGEIVVIPVRVEHSVNFETNGFVIKNKRKKILYFPDFKSLNLGMSLIKNADVAILDGQYILGKYMKDPEHLDGERLIKIVSIINAKKVFLMAVSEHWFKSTKERIMQHLPNNFFVPNDGLSIII